MADTLKIHNGETVAYSSLPLAPDYESFSAWISESLACESNHCVNYFGMAEDGKIRLICCIALDSEHLIAVNSCLVECNAALQSTKIIALERYEREIAENFGITFEGHPWFKPVRTASDDYPFYHADSEELHEVGVGPIHAGVIEPGHFRFICEGEKIRHLEIMLGYQHRGVEPLMVSAPFARKELIAESIAGDTAVSHSTAYAIAMESLSGVSAPRQVAMARTIAAELERIAIHTGDLSAICGDVAYQLGSAVYGRLRTPIINFMQKWCGNRLGKTCVRPFECPYNFTTSLRDQLLETLAAYEKDFNEISAKICHFPSVLSRLERTGVVTLEQAREIGAVGMAAKASGICRDVRQSHPYNSYTDYAHEPVVKHHGDVRSRTQVRIEEVRQSLAYIRQALAEFPYSDTPGGEFGSYALQASSFVVALTEGWRGEICHCAITDAAGALKAYKICDPSFHNWMALALAVRKNGISDFPICNKSFNLSYCGHDL